MLWPDKGVRAARKVGKPCTNGSICLHKDWHAFMHDDWSELTNTQEIQVAPGEPWHLPLHPGNQAFSPSVASQSQGSRWALWCRSIAEWSAAILTGDLFARDDRAAPRNLWRNRQEWRTRCQLTPSWCWCRSLGRQGLPEVHPNFQPENKVQTFWSSFSRRDVATNEQQLFNSNEQQLFNSILALSNVRINWTIAGARQ